MGLLRWSRHASMIAGGLLLGGGLVVQLINAQEPPLRFGGAYSELDERRQHLINDWVVRFIKTTGQPLEAAPFYDDILSLSMKTTFDAVTQALISSSLTDASGVRMGDALVLVERIDTIRGEVAGASGDRQFRIYVRLTPGARTMLDRSREFKRASDNSVYHKGYPLNYREQGGTPSIQISVAMDGRQADIDVDYRSSSFPMALFNGHLSAANSDVRAGNNAVLHTERWAGFQNWWRSFFGIHLDRVPDTPEKDSLLTLSKIPRVGEKKIDVMVQDFLHAWLVEGDVVAAMGYVSERSYACLALDAPDPSAFDRGLAPFQLMVNLKAAHDALGAHTSLEGLTVGVRLVLPGLKVVSQPNHAQFVIYSVPDDVAAAFDCETQAMPGAPKKVSRKYGNFFGSTFYVNGRQDQRVALLWARDNGYWKIVSWKTGVDDGDSPMPATPAVKLLHVKADPGFVQAAQGFLETWLIRKDYDAAFRYLSTRSYACYDLGRGPDVPASTSLDDAGRKLRASLEFAGERVGVVRNLDAILSAPEPLHPSVRVMDHAHARTFSLTSIPTALGDASQCEARARGATPPEPMPLQYGEDFVLAVRFRTAGGEAPVLRVLWQKEQDAWRVTSYDVELP